MNESLKRWILNWLAGLERFFIKRYLPNDIFLEEISSLTFNRYFLESKISPVIPNLINS